MLPDAAMPRWERPHTRAFRRVKINKTNGCRSQRERYHPFPKDMFAECRERLHRETQPHRTLRNS
jgi:hypothetical protein